MSNSRSMQKLAARTGGFQAYKSKEEPVDKLSKTDRQWNTAKIISLQKQISHFEHRNIELEQELLRVDSDISAAQSDLNVLNKKIAQKPKSDVYRTSEAGMVQVKALMTSVAVSQHSKNATGDMGSYCGSSMSTAMKLKTTSKQLDNKIEKRLVDLSSLLSQNKAMRTKIDELRREIMLNGQIIDNLNSEHCTELRLITEVEDKKKGAERARETLKAKYSLSMVNSKQQNRDLKREVKGIREDIHHENLQSLNRIRSTMSAEKNRASKSRFDNFSTLTKKDFREEAVEEVVQTKNPYENYSGKFNFNLYNLGRTRQISDKELEELDEQKRKLEADSSNYDSILRQFYDQAKTPIDEDLDQAILKYELHNQEYQKENNDTRFWADKLDSLMQLRDTIKQEIEIVKKEKNVDWKHRDDLVAFYQQMILDNQDKMQAYSQKMEQNKKALFSIRIAIPEIFRKIGCEPARDNLYQEKEVNDTNIEEYLSLIEKRADEILTMYHAKPSDAYNNGGGSTSQISGHGSKSKLSQQKAKEAKNSSVEKLLQKVSYSKQQDKDMALVSLSADKMQDNRQKAHKVITEMVNEELKSAIVN